MGDGSEFLKRVMVVVVVGLIIVALFIPLNNVPLIGQFIPLVYENTTGMFLIMSNIDLLGSAAMYTALISVIIILIKSR